MTIKVIVFLLRNILNLSPNTLGLFESGSEKALGKWILLRTRSRQEKAVSADLTGKGIGHFLPLARQIRYYGRRKSIVDLPLFSGYVFMRGVLEQAYEVDRSRRIASIINVNNQIELNEELKSISIAFENRTELNPYPYLSVGRKVEVRAGPLRGLRGRVESIRPSLNRLYINVEMLGRAVSLEIDGSLLDVL